MRQELRNPMSELQLIENVLSQTERRRRRERAYRGLWQGLFIGATVWCVTLVAHKLLPTPYWTLPAAAGLGVATVLACVIAGAWRRHSVSETARWVDGRQRLQERLSTALEVSRVNGSESWRELIVADAVTQVKQLDPRKLVQFHLPRGSRWALLLLALGIGLGFVPEYRSTGYVQKQTEQKAIKEAGKQLVELTKHTLTNRPPALESTEKSLEAVNDLGDQMTKKITTRDQAIKDLAKMSDRLKDEIKDFAKDPALRRMEEAARSQENNSSDMNALQKQIQDAQKQLGDNTATPDQMDKLNKQLSELQEAAKAEMDKNGDMSQSDKNNLTQSLAALSKQAQSLGMNMPNLDQAIQALAASQANLAIKDMQTSSEDLQKMSDMAKSLQQMQQQQAGQEGKDLAEQLKYGQPEVAQRTLQKMMDQLKSGAMTQEQMQQMMSEVSKAVEPGSKYGKAGDFLKQAAQQMGQGQKPGAAQSLADASKELDKLMQQMGDAKSLMAELSALNQAAMGIGNCTNPGAGGGLGDGTRWGLKPSLKTGLGKGGRPGRGVGMWEDENGGWGYNGQQTGLWDNTGVTRPDAKPKGLSDRDAEENPGLIPTQVKGQFQPGGPMPSIKVKGVSIRGTSAVQYQEEAVAAQSDAQSALSQEKVPRAYRDSVRDYFDDLKK